MPLPLCNRTGSMVMMTTLACITRGRRSQVRTAGHAAASDSSLLHSALLVAWHLTMSPHALVCSNVCGSFVAPLFSGIMMLAALVYLGIARLPYVHRLYKTSAHAQSLYDEVRCTFLFWVLVCLLLHFCCRSSKLSCPIADVLFVPCFCCCMLGHIPLSAIHMWPLGAALPLLRCPCRHLGPDPLVVLAFACVLSRSSRISSPIGGCGECSQPGDPMRTSTSSFG